MDFNLSFFVEVFSITAWKIWKQRNGKIFRGLHGALLSGLEELFPPLP
jgi:hypothetical protein